MGSQRENEETSWVDRGQPLQAVAELISRPVVTTQEFHRVYARVLGDTVMSDSLLGPGIRYLFEELLHAEDERDITLLKSGLIRTVQLDNPTAGMSGRYDASVQVAIDNGDESIMAFVAQNRDLWKLLQYCVGRYWEVLAAEPW